MIVEQVQILDRDHLFTRHRSKSSVLCCVHHGEDKEQRLCDISDSAI